MERQNNVLRMEQKYQCPEWKKVFIESALQPYLERDAHVGSSGGYLIRSLYFDDDSDSCLKDNLMGIRHRKKYRIRYYGNRADRLFLEKKEKIDGFTKKTSCPISKELCEKLIQNKEILLENDYELLMKEFLIERMKKLLTPRIIISYFRIPFTYPVERVRITFDTQLHYSLDIGNFMKEQFIEMPFLNMQPYILEVKYNEYLPYHIREIFEGYDLTQSAFSKYVVGRGESERRND